MAKAKKYPKLDYVCSMCGSADVLADAYVEWDTEEQEWVVQNVFDKGSYCNACDGEASLNEVVIAMVEP